MFGFRKKDEPSKYLEIDWGKVKDTEDLKLLLSSCWGNFVKDDSKNIEKVRKYLKQ